MRIRVTGITVRDDKVLMVEYDDPKIGFHLNFPGGGLDPGETLHQGLVRELSEECSLEVVPGRLLTVSEHWKEGELDTLFFAFEAIAADGAQPCMSLTPDTFQTGVGWYAWDDLDNYNVLPPIHRALQSAVAKDERGYVGVWQIGL